MRSTGSKSSAAQTPILRIEVPTVHDPSQVPGNIKFPFNEGAINDEFRGFIRELVCAPSLVLAPHWLEVALHAVNANGNAVLQSEVLRVFRQDGSERA
jgi:hypothetical protein